MSEAIATQDEVKTFRGGSIEELLPRIREELGPEAVILRQREGLVGGVGGFFQKRCIEVDARSGGAGIDVYDEEGQDEMSAGPGVPSGEGSPAGGAVAPFSDSPPLPPPAETATADALVRNDGATREGLATPAIREVVGQAEPFAQMLDGFRPGEALAEEQVQAGVTPELPARAERLVAGMVGCGLEERIARGVVEAVLANAMPFATPARLRTLVRNELALRLPVAPLPGPGARTVVAVGPNGSGASEALAAIGAAHAAAGTPVTRGDLRRPPHPSDLPEGGLLLLEAPPLWGGAPELAEVAATIAALEGAEVHLALRAGTAAAAAAELHDGLAALAPTRLLLSGAGESSHLGGVLGLAIDCGLPLAYVAVGATEIAPADPRDLASRVVP